MSDKKKPKEIMNRKEAAAYINYAPNTLATWACKNRYDLKYFRIGRNIRYHRSELDRFLESRLIK
ncbi:MAG TPA: helix-turn-helix domain-containing protein [Mucilaginibacter sp.]|nr:helix-turn-helix domain-containing protein [Mucilaginibacter sp.]